MEKKQNFATYEYTSKTVSPSNQTSTIDFYEAFGWTATDVVNSLTSVTISFKRNRKHPHKTELNRLMRKAEDLKQRIVELNASKTKKPRIIALTLGICFTLIFGGGMSLCMLNPDDLPYFICGIALGAVGLLLCGLNYLIYNKNVIKKTNEANPLIDECEEKIAIVCEQAHGLAIRD